MAAPKKTPLPAILLANDLLDGDVVFRAAAGWTRDPRGARVATTREAADQLEGEAAAAMARHEVVDAYLVEVATGADGAPTPTHFRERFKVSGPSHRRDLGKQAEFATADVITS